MSRSKVAPETRAFAYRGTDRGYALRVASTHLVWSGIYDATDVKMWRCAISMLDLEC